MNQAASPVTPEVRLGSHEPAQQRAQDRPGDGHHQEREPEEVLDGGARGGFRARRGLRGRRQRLALDRLQDRVHAVVDAAREVAGAKARRDALGDDAPGERVREHALDAAPRLDAHAPLLLGDHEEDAVVHARAPELPLVGHARGELLDRLGADRGHEEHRHLRALGLLEGGELGGDGLLLWRVQRSREVDHPPRELRDGDRVRRARGERREREEERRGRSREEPAGEAGHLAGAGCAGAAGLGEKSTLGGSAIAFSFSTVKLAFSL